MVLLDDEVNDNHDQVDATLIAEPVPLRKVQLKKLIVEDRRSKVTWIGNSLWLFLGSGLIIALVYAVLGFAFCITVILFPIGIQLLKLAKFALFPFGRGLNVVQHYSIKITLLDVLASIIWLPLGLALAIVHTVFACLFFCTIIGAPFGLQHLKLAAFALYPFALVDDEGIEYFEETITQLEDTSDEFPDSGNIPIASEVREPLIQSSYALLQGIQYQYVVKLTEWSFVVLIPAAIPSCATKLSDFVMSSAVLILLCLFDYCL